MNNGISGATENEHFVVAHVIGGVHVPEQRPRGHQRLKSRHGLQRRGLHTRRQPGDIATRTREGNW